MIITNNSFLWKTLLFPNAILRNEIWHPIKCSTGSLTRVPRRNRMVFLDQSVRLYGENTGENILILEVNEADKMKWQGKKRNILKRLKQTQGNHKAIGNKHIRMRQAEGQKMSSISPHSQWKLTWGTELQNGIHRQATCSYPGKRKL